MKHNPPSAAPAREGPRLLHPFLFALAPILLLFAHNARELPLFDRSAVGRLLLPCAVSLFMSWALAALARRFIARDRLAAGLLASLLLSSFFAFGHAQTAYLTALERLGGDVRTVIHGVHFGHYRLFFLAWALGTLLLSWAAARWLRRRPQRVPGLTVFLNRMAAALLLMAAARIAWAEIGRARTGGTRLEAAEPSSAARGGAPVARPDIYYIILDSYAAADTLRDSYGFDNSEFINYLKRKGFFVASRSRSNYTSTLMSLGSSLNLEHLAFLGKQLGPDSTNLTLPLRMIENSRVMRFLKDNGYSFVNFRTPAGPAARNRYADWDVSCDRGLIDDEFLRLLVETTILEPFFRARNARASRERILCQLSTLSRLPAFSRVRRPVFVLAHVLCPHWPYIFSRDGGPVDGEESRRTPKKKLYVNQLIFLNGRLRDMLDRLLAQEKPLIILQGDHGPLDHEEGTRRTLLRNRTRILNAYLLPGGAGGLYDSITPVNTFRVILNRFFGTAYPLLEDRTYYSDPNDNYHYRLEDVTGQVRYDP